MSPKMQQTERTRKKPQRKCTACGQMKDKTELLRVIKDANGAVSIDASQKANGRGAYICKSAECMAKAKKMRSLERSLKCGIDPGIYERLLALTD